MMQGLCETCQNMREVHSARSRFLLCELSVRNPAYPKYPRQPVVQCEGYQCKDEALTQDDPGEEEREGH